VWRGQTWVPPDRQRVAQTWRPSLSKKASTASTAIYIQHPALWNLTIDSLQFLPIIPPHFASPDLDLKLLV